jgi:LVIVD repeat
MSHFRLGFAGLYFRQACLASAAAAFLCVPGAFANNEKPTGVPAKVIAHLSLEGGPGSQMLLQSRDDKKYLYVQKASKDGFTIVDVTTPQHPTVVKTTSDAAAGKLEMAGSNVALAVVPDKNAKGVLHNTDNPTQSVNILDMSDPTHPKVIQTFKHVSSILQDPGRGLIFLANNNGLWILNYPKPGILETKPKAMKPCGSESALQAMPPDCE